jgi:hypothetical protein
MLEADQEKISLPLVPPHYELKRLGQHVSYCEQIIAAKRLAKLQVEDEEIDLRGDDRIMRSVVRDCPAPKRFTGTKESFDEHIDDFTRYAVGTGLPLQQVGPGCGDIHRDTLTCLHTPQGAADANEPELGMAGHSEQLVLGAVL